MITYDCAFAQQVSLFILCFRFTWHWLSVYGPLLMGNGLITKLDLQSNWKVNIGCAQCFPSPLSSQFFVPLYNFAGLVLSIQLQCFSSCQIGLDMHLHLIPLLIWWWTGFFPPSGMVFLSMRILTCWGQLSGCLQTGWSQERQSFFLLRNW